MVTQPLRETRKASKKQSIQYTILSNQTINVKLLIISTFSLIIRQFGDSYIPPADQIITPGDWNISFIFNHVDATLFPGEFYDMIKPPESL